MNQSLHSSSQPYVPIYMTSPATSLKSSRSASVKSGLITAMSSKPNSIGTSRTSVSATPTSSAARLSSMGKSNDHTDQTVRNSTNFSAIKVMSISKKNWENGSAFTTSIGHMALTTEKRLTKYSEKSYNKQAKCPTGNRTLQA